MSDPKPILPQRRTTRRRCFVCQAPMEAQRIAAARAGFEHTTIADLMTGQHSDSRRVVMFNPDTDRAEDVSHAIAQEILRRLDLERRNVPSELEGFIDHHVGRDRQLTLRLAY
jgi:hypothetical protein